LEGVREPFRRCLKGVELAMVGMGGRDVSEVKDKLSGSGMVFGQERFSVGNGFRSGKIFGREWFSVGNGFRSGMVFGWVGNGGSGGG
jgi:hypothetical protein